jgi:hypothetical protein
MSHPSAIEQITIRGIDAETGRRVRAYATEAGLSLNRAIVRLLQEATGVARGPGRYGGAKIGEAALKYAGTWTDAECQQMLDSVAELDRMDAEHGW